MKKCPFIFITLLIVNSLCFSQKTKQYKVHTVAFYNLENLFDTTNDVLKFDEESPIMKIKVDREAIYKKKIKNMAKVISGIGFEKTNNAPAILGIAEIENKEVLQDLINDSLLIDRSYGIIHFDSPDLRGIDVALLYQKHLFSPSRSIIYELKIFSDNTNKRLYTRDVLLVSGYFEGEPMHFIVNHWPSRRGGKAKSEYKRIAAGQLTKRIMDSLQTADPYAKVFIMGDFNDNPTDKSIKTLKSHKHKSHVELKELYNPFEQMFKQGIGTTAYRDQWSLFDQILITKPLLKSNDTSYQFYKAGIFNPPYLIVPTGRYKNYPYRSWSAGAFNNGFSDHFPVYMYIVKAVD